MQKVFEGFPISSITTINPPLGEDSGSAGNDDNLNTESDNVCDDDQWHDDERGEEDKFSTDDSGEYHLGEGSNDAVGLNRSNNGVQTSVRGNCRKETTILI